MVSKEHKSAWQDGLSLQRTAQYSEMILKGVSGPVLDVGCGYWSPVAQASPSGGITCIEINSEYAKIARDRTPLNDFIVADAMKLPIRDGAADLVLAPFLIDVVKSNKIPGLLSELMRTSKDGKALLEISAAYQNLKLRCRISVTKVKAIAEGIDACLATKRVGQSTFMEVTGKFDKE